MKRIRAVAYIKNEVATWGKMTRAIGFVKEGILAAEIVMRGLDPIGAKIRDSQPESNLIQAANGACTA
jgi:hypothetical protein